VIDDESQLTRLLQKLVENAIRLHGPQTPRVDVAASRFENEWVFCLKDSGMGIELERLPVYLNSNIAAELDGDLPQDCRTSWWKNLGDIGAGDGSEFCFSLPGRPT